MRHCLFSKFWLVQVHMGCLLSLSFSSRLLSLVVLHHISLGSLCQIRLPFRHVSRGGALTRTTVGAGRNLRNGSFPDAQSHYHVDARALAPRGRRPV